MEILVVEEKVTRLRDRLWFKVFCASAVFGALSFLTYYLPGLKPWVFAAIVIGAVALAVRDLRALFLVMIAEAVIGAHGHLFAVAIGDGVFSVRMALFGILAVGWLLHVIKDRSHLKPFLGSGLLWPLVAVAAMIGWGLLRGLMMRIQSVQVIGDADAYAFILMIPIALDLIGDRRAFSDATQVFAGALAWLAAKSLVLLYFFSHVFTYFQPDLFFWQRRFWLTEITRQGTGLYRVFSASDLFLIVGVFAGCLLLARRPRRSLWAWATVVTAAFVLSLSRSFWLGAVAAVAIFFPVFWRKGVVAASTIRRSLLRGSALTGLALLVLLAVMFFPLPAPLVGKGDLGIFGTRFTDISDTAVSSRWNELPPLEAKLAAHPVLGSGFGTMITYKSDDPRIISLYPGGVIMTPAIEWQYLEIWLKMGLFGLAAIVWLCLALSSSLKKALRTPAEDDRLLAAALTMSLAAFLVANIFTPYFNHPLGWMYLALVAAATNALKPHTD